MRVLADDVHTHESHLHSFLCLLSWTERNQCNPVLSSLHPSKQPRFLSVIALHAGTALSLGYSSAAWLSLLPTCCLVKHSGCVTSAETVLITQQSTAQLESDLKSKVERRRRGRVEYSQLCPYMTVQLFACVCVLSVMAIGCHVHVFAVCGISSHRDCTAPYSRLCAPCCCL